MDFLQLGLIFLILLISIFLAIAGLQVFFILKDLHKTLKKLDKILATSQDIADDIEKPAKLVSNIATGLENGGKTVASVAKAIAEVVRKPKKPRFYKKILR